MKNKDSKARMQVIFGVIFFTLILTAELYAMINYAKLFVLIVGLAVVDLLFLYMVINGLMVLQEQKNIRREEQYESIFKSQKASYLMLKKYFEEIEDKLNYLEAAAKVPTEEIVKAQKGIAKVIINHSRENTEALMNSYEQIMDEMGLFEDRFSSITSQMNENKDQILTAQKNSEEINEKELQIKLQDVMVAMKDMELRLNNAIMQSQKMIAQAPVAPVPIPPTPVMQALAPEAPMQAEKESSAEENSELERNVEPELEPKVEVAAEPEAEAEPEPAAAPEPEAEPAVVEPEPVLEETKQEEIPPMPDLSDPNKAMSPDEIAALFANMGGGNAEETPVEEELIPEAELAVVEPEPVLEETKQEELPPMPDLSDPNRAMSPDEIAALFANMGVDSVAEPDPDPEPVVTEPDLFDPNKQLSPDEIAALFASMGN